MHDKNAELQLRFRTRIPSFIIRHASTLAPEEAESLLRQFTPDVRELRRVPGFGDDPLHEDDPDIQPFPDVVHKYRNKILYLASEECPVFCRYCTRKRRTLMVAKVMPTPLAQIASYLESHPEINEVIFSGGDPLMLNRNELLQRLEFFLRLAQIRFVRIHTRAATTAPQLFSQKFLGGLAALRRDFPQKLITFVLHINTAAEISSECREIVKNLKETGIGCYAQSVLLRKINDSPQKLAELFLALYQAGIQPYYLHQLDRVTGSAHFAVSDARARRLYAATKELVPPYILPRLVRDSKQGKFPL
ncbi:MAG: KamA family radical SAM protein [Leptospiraceae bacterium]|nr:KamA family radical SAM protein [Leptospiraceae bacterium]